MSGTPVSAMINSTRTMITLGRFLAFLLLCSGLLNPPTVGASADPDEQIICGGIVIAEKALLRSEPDSGSAVIKKLQFGTPFYSLGDPEVPKRSNRRDYPGREPPPWFHVLLPDSTTYGWIAGTEGREAVFVYTGLEGPDFHLLWYIGSRRDDFAYQRYLVGLRSLHEKNYETAERLFRQLLDNQPEVEIRYYDNYILTRGSARTGASMGLAIMYRSMREYEKALEHYEMIVSDSTIPTEARAKAGLMMIRIYDHDLRDHDSGLQTAYRIMVAFPGQPTNGFEHYGKADVEAGEYAFRMLSEEPPSPPELLIHGHKMIGLASDPTVKMIGHVLLCKGYRRQKEYERLKDTAMQAVLRWPTATGAGYKEDMRVDYSREVLELVVESLTEDLDDYDQALAFCEELISETEHPTLHKNLLCARARLLDVLQTSKEAVVSAYQECNHWRVRKRLNTILSFQEYEAIISVGQVAVKSRPARQAKDLFILSKRNRVTVLYEDPKRYDQEDWLKIQASGDRIGWVERSTFTPE
ncbi:SH3 domain-containing protein [candidate division TA06 bacterium]|uniref:SH3 domain-containing protein n=1 Tax=candidate division TA06 bacterium TaxID=2250710 RepID=A0A523UVU6_UNCT6|nr:MAG: SH3 domain-containing protein [candidate division TA06 bacterium]